MSDDILDAIEKFFEFEYDIVYEFKVTYGLTFAFKTTTTIFNIIIYPIMKIRFIIRFIINKSME